MASQFRDRRRVEALFRALATDYLLREQFVTDPAQILTEYVSGRRLEPDAAAAANHLVYAMVSNPRLLRWLETYGREHAEVPAGEDFASDFARALARDGDEQTLMAVVRAANEADDLFSVQAEVVRGLIAALASGRAGSVFAGTEMSSPGTEISPGPGTEVSSAVFEDRGGVFRGTEMSSPGTEISPGPGTEVSSAVFEDRGGVFRGTEMSSPGTEISPGPGTEVSSGVFEDRGGVFRGTEMSSPGTEISPGPGTEVSSGVFRDRGAVFRGTEMSSPGTEISPGPGTDISPGPGRVAGIDVDVTMRALVDFASQLRSAGALNVVRFQ